MRDLILGIICTAIGGALTVAVIAIANSLRTRSSLPRRVERLEAASSLTLDILDAQTDGITASLIALKEGKVNGEATAALDRLRETKGARSKFLAAQAMGGNCK